METPSTKLIKEETTTKRKVISPKMIVIAAFLLIIAGIVGFVVYHEYQVAKMEDAYQKAISVKESGDYAAAIMLFVELEDYKDSPEMILKCYDAISLESLQTIYQAISVTYLTDNKLIDIVSDVMSSVDSLKGVPLVSPSSNRAISALYDGKGYRAYAKCSLYEVAQIKAVVPSAQVDKGDFWYDVSIPIFSVENAQIFVDSIKSANTLMETLEEAISNTGDLTATYQEIEEQLLLTYEALKDYHSFATKKPTDYENYSIIASEKKIAVRDLLEKLPSTVKASIK